MGVVGVGQITLFDQNDTPIASLSNYAHAVPSAADGSSPNLTGAVSTFQILLAGIDITNLYSVTATPLAGITGTLATYTYTVATMTVDVGYIDFTATRPGFATLTKRFSLAKSKQGIIGPQGIDSPACLGLFNYADRGTITGMVSGSLAVLYSVNVEERGIYAYLASMWVRQTAPTPDQIARTFLYVIEAVRLGYGHSSHYLSGSTSLEILLVAFLYVLKIRLGDTGALFSGGYDENGNISKDGDGNDLPGAFISGTGAFAGVGAIFKSLVAKILKTNIMYNGAWVKGGWGSSSVIESATSRNPSIVALPNGTVVCVYTDSVNNYIRQKIRAQDGTWGGYSIIEGVYSNNPVLTLLSDGRVLCVYRDYVSGYLREKIRGVDGSWGSYSIVESSNCYYIGLATLPDDSVVCVFLDYGTAYLKTKVRSANGVWGTASVIESVISESIALTTLGDGSVVCVYKDNATGYLRQKIRAPNGTWGNYSIIESAKCYKPSLNTLPDTSVLLVYEDFATGYLRQKIRAPNGTWGNYSVIDADDDASPSITVLPNAKILCVFFDKSTLYLKEKIDTSSYSSIPVGTIETDVGSGVVEVGQNTNGTYIKFGDGTLICYAVIGCNNYPQSIVFPAAFININYSLTHNVYVYNTACLTSNENHATRTASGSSCWTYNAISQQPALGGYLIYTAIGRWK